MMQAYSALPFNITSGVTTVQGTAGRPIVNGAFIPRNAGIGSDFFSASLRLSRTFNLSGRVRLEGLVEGFNLTNRTNVVAINGNFGAGAYPTNPSLVVRPGPRGWRAALRSIRTSGSGSDNAEVQRAAIGVPGGGVQHLVSLRRLRLRRWRGDANRPTWRLPAGPTRTSRWRRTAIASARRGRPTGPEGTDIYAAVSADGGRTFGRAGPRQRPRRATPARTASSRRGFSCRGRRSRSSGFRSAPASRGFAPPPRRMEG